MACCGRPSVPGDPHPTLQFVLHWSDGGETVYENYELAYEAQDKSRDLGARMSSRRRRSP